MGIERPNVWDKGYRAVQRKGSDMTGFGHYFSRYSIISVASVWTNKYK
jgi:hypothetical protein